MGQKLADILARIRPPYWPEFGRHIGWKSGALRVRYWSQYGLEITCHMEMKTEFHLFKVFYSIL